MSFLGLAGKTFVVVGVANKKSVAYAIARSLEQEGAMVVYSVRSEARRKSLAALLADRPVFICDVEQDGAISSFSLVELARAFKPLLAKDASVVTIGISSLSVTPDNYGYMGPIKAALESTTRFLAKSFSADSEVRFNVVGAGPLKTSASAGIPGYIESYLYTEKLTFRKRNLDTQEVANTVLFLLSSRSSGLNGTTLVVDAGLGLNFYDKEIIRLAMRLETGKPHAE